MVGKPLRYGQIKVLRIYSEADLITKFRAVSKEIHTWTMFSFTPKLDGAVPIQLGFMLLSVGISFIMHPIIYSILGTRHYIKDATDLFKSIIFKPKNK